MSIGGYSELQFLGQDQPKMATSCPAAEAGDDGEMLCVSLKCNRKTILQPYAFTINDPRMTFWALMQSNEKISSCLNLDPTDKMQIHVFCSEKLDSDKTIEVHY